jgi:RimJ/RimL family protein N-acetyltransferase
VAELSYPDPPLADEEVVLRPFREQDIAAVVAACQDPEIVRFTKVPDRYGEAEARDWRDESDRQRRQGQGIHFLIFDAAGAELLGSIGLHELDWEERRASIGYWTAAAARQRGVAGRGVKVLSRWAFADLGLARVQIFADVENPASQRVAERAGFVREGVLRSYSQLDGRRYDAAIFSLLPSDLEDRPD